jgi:hypothetical protein
MTLYVADAQAHVQRLVSVFKMVAVHVLPKSISLLCLFCGQKLNKKINKEIFHVYSGRCVSHKAVQNWIKKFSERWVWNRGGEVAEIIFKRPVCCGFLPNGKELGQVYQCRWRGIHFFFRTFYIHLWPIYWLFLVHSFTYLENIYRADTL